MHRFWPVLVTILLAFSLAVIADDNPKAKSSSAKNKVFKCEKNGVVIFSQLACSDDAKVVTIKMSQGRPDNAVRERNLKRQQDVKQYVEAQDKSRGISRHRARVERYKQQMAKEFAQLKQTRFHSVQAKDEALDVLSKKYNALITIEHEAIKALHEQGKTNP
ncbi:MAG: hypothetical protein HRT35_13795 [Algicola sp.]|nr:hypothetical protein [Algicola sp.]